MFARDLPGRLVVYAKSVVLLVATACAPCGLPNLEAGQVECSICNKVF